jgi:hypothetical protein
MESLKPWRLSASLRMMRRNIFVWQMISAS